MAMLGEILQKAFLLSIGLFVGGGALYLVYFRDSYRWRYLENVYGAPWKRPLETRYLQSAVAYGDGVASKSYNGILTIRRA